MVLQWHIGSSVLLKTIIFIIACLVLYASQHPALDRFEHRISDLDLTLQLPKTGLDFGSNRSDHRSFYTSEAAQRFCKHHGYSVFTPQPDVGQRKVYDLFMVNTELDWMEVRLNTTYHHVDYFIIVESPKTFTGKPKPLTIKENWDRFKPYHDKLIYHQLEFPPDFNPTRSWDYEDLQRNAMYSQVFPRLAGKQAPVYGDVILVADVDEIARPETLLVLRTCHFPRRLTLHSRFYYYSFQFLHTGPEWNHPQATYFQGSRTISPANLRTGDGGFKPLYDLEKGNLANACWHCSSCFATVEEFLTKMASFSHEWMNGERFRDKDRIADAIRNGKDLWGRAIDQFERLENNTDVPGMLLGEPKRFSYMLNRDGPSAGFTDYP
ncbi:glycosyl transferase family 17 protein [Colletotrichum truncatum]|uniref:Glycosyl transferase family 17 protein n=1 Tax=Colletotrichum truncatum TaxID=5467 RepID=A0ACC3Z5Q5_COLTU|nr:glycosyl transferase family 17 protein [Colletotrichum truncatum]KAF6795277.1 glycosyl transferase family 17 protein [Colletotrichum truncatum]